MQETLFALLTQVEARNQQFVAESLDVELIVGAPWLPWLRFLEQ